VSPTPDPLRIIPLSIKTVLSQIQTPAGTDTTSPIIEESMAACTSVYEQDSALIISPEKHSPQSKSPAHPSFTVPHSSVLQTVLGTHGSSGSSTTKSYSSSG